MTAPSVAELGGPSTAARAGPAPRHVVAVAAGNALEFYDFLTYAFFAGQIGRTFFPSEHPTASLLASLATFGAGFLMRPVGGVVIGRIGDRIGRRPAMVLSFTLMGVAMTVLALTPSFSQIGVIAPVIVIAARLVQGFALGGEVGPSTSFLVEAAPPHRRGFFVSLQYMGQDTAVLVAGLIGFGLSSALTPAALDAWGWRAAFLVGAVIVPFGLMLRRSLPETLHDVAQVEGPPAKLPLAGFFLLGLMMLAGGTTVGYVLNYLTTYSSETLHMPAQLAFAATVVLGLFGVIFDPIGGMLADRFGRKPVMIVPWVILLLITVPAFNLIATARSAEALLGMTALLSIASAISSSSVLTALTEGLPKRIRCGALGLLYAVAISIFGGSTQFTVTWLTDVSGSPLAPAWYMTGGIAVALLAMLFMPETAPRVLDRRTAAAAEPAPAAALP